MNFWFVGLFLAVNTRIVPTLNKVNRWINVLRRLILSIWKHANSTAEFFLSYSPVGKSSWFNVPKYIFEYDDGDNTGYFPNAVYEVIKPILLLFNGFHMTGICQKILTLFKMGERGSAKQFPTSFPQHLWPLVLIVFPQFCKISRPYLVPVLN